jgi:hypothetical protein
MAARAISPIGRASAVSAVVQRYLVPGFTAGGTKG